MSFIDTPADSEIYAADEARLGYVPNFVRLFGHRPDVYAAWRGLIGAITAHMDPRRYELATFAAARALRSSYCALAHGKVLTERWLAPDEVMALAQDGGAQAPLDDVEVAVMAFAERVVRDAASVTRGDIERLRTLGLGDDEILDVALAAAARCFFSKTLDALGTSPDAAYRSLLGPQLCDALTVGRAVAEG